MSRSKGKLLRKENATTAIAPPLAKDNKHAKAGEGAEVTLPEVKSFSRVFGEFLTGNEISREDGAWLQTETQEITTLYQSMVVNALAIGERLLSIRARIGGEKFGIFAKSVMPRLGISRSSTYLYMGRYEVLARRFPDSNVRGYLVAASQDGKGLITVDVKSGKAELSASLGKALQKVGPPPKDKETEHWQQWAGQVIAVSRKDRASARVGGGTIHNARVACLTSIARFAVKYGADKAIDLCSRADKLAHQLEAAMKVATVGNKQAAALASAIALNKPAPAIKADEEAA